VPENHATPLEALLLPETPTDVHYRRNHFEYPEVGLAGWALEVTGAVERPLWLTLDEIQRLPSRELRALLECAGHRRTEYLPPVAGVQWKTGALGQARWRGASLADVLRQAGVRAGAVEVVLRGADRGPFSGEGEYAFERSLPLDKALDPDTLLAWEMNGEPLPKPHGAPLRAVVPGWYAMDSIKWLLRVEVVTEPFRGPFQELDYRFKAADDPGIGRRLARIPVSSLIVEPGEGASLRPGRIMLRGIAWGGEGGIEGVHVRLDEGEYRAARLSPPEGPYGKSAWEAECELPPGEHVVSVRARDRSGQLQPEQAEWNQRGYANNGVHRVRVRVE